MFHNQKKEKNKKDVQMKYKLIQVKVAVYASMGQQLMPYE